MSILDSIRDIIFKNRNNKGQALPSADRTAELERRIAELEAQAKIDEEKIAGLENQVKNKDRLLKMAVRLVAELRREIKELKIEIKEWYEVDRLTETKSKAWNRKNFDSINKQILEAIENKKSYTMLFADLNNVKYLNDLKGHDVTDEAMRAMFKEIKKVAEPLGIEIVRAGGDEFKFYAPNMSKEEAKTKLIEPCLKLIEENIERFKGLRNGNWSSGYTRFIFR